MASFLDDEPTAQRKTSGSSGGSFLDDDTFSGGFNEPTGAELGGQRNAELDSPPTNAALEAAFGFGLPKIPGAAPILKGIVSPIATSPQAFGSFLREFGETSTFKSKYPKINIGPVEIDTKFTTGPFGLMELWKDAKAEIYKITGEDKRISEMGTDLIKANREWVDNNPYLELKEKDRLSQFLFGLGSGVTTAAVAYGASYLTRNPMAAASLFALYQKGNIFQEIRESGGSPEEASRLSTQAGVIEGLLEFVGIDYFMKVGGAPIKAALKRSVSEALQEASQTLGENLLAKTNWDNDRDLQEGLLDSFLIGGILGGGVSSVVSIAERNGVREKLMEAGLTKEESNDLIKVIANRQESLMSDFVEEEIKKTQAHKEILNTAVPDSIQGNYSKEVGREKAKANLYNDVSIFEDRLVDVLSNPALDPEDLVLVVPGILEEAKVPLREFANSHLTGEEQIKALSLIEKIKPGGKILTKSIAKLFSLEENEQKKEAVKTIKKTADSIDTKKLRPEYGFVKDILNSLDFINRREKTVKRLESLKNYLKDNPENNVPKETLDKLDILSKKKLKDLKSFEINMINDTLKHLMHLQKLKNKILFSRKYVALKETLAKAVENLSREAIKEPEGMIYSNKKTSIEKGPIKDIATTKSYNMELIARILDKEDKGPIWQILYKGIDDGTTDLLKIKQLADDFFFQRINFDITNWSESFYPKKQRNKVDRYSYTLDSGKIIQLTPAERIAFYLHTKRFQSLRHLRSGGFSFSNNLSRTFTLSDQDIKKISSSLSQKELHVANLMSYYLNNTQKAHINKTSVELDGYERATEDNYWPEDTNLYERKSDSSKIKKHLSGQTIEGSGFLKETTKAKGALVLEDAFTALYKSIKLAAAYSGLAAPLRAAKYLSNNRDFQKEVDKNYGPKMLRSIQNYLTDVEGSAATTEGVDKILFDVVNKIDRAILSLNAPISLKQMVSLLGAQTEMSPKYIGRAFGIRAVESREEMSKWSPQLRDRFEGHISREMGEISNIGESNKFWTHRSQLDKRLMSWIRYFDYQAIGRIWKASQFEIEDLRPELTGDKKMEAIAERTEEIVRLTQPTFNIKDRSEIGRSRSLFVRLATRYSSQRNKNYIMIRRAVEKYNTSNKTWADKRSLMFAMAVLAVEMPTLLLAIDYFRDFLFGKKLSKKPVETALLKYLSINLGNVYFVGTIFNSLASNIEKGSYAGYDINDVLTSTVQEGVDGLYQAYTALSQALSQEVYVDGKDEGDLKWKKSAMRSADRLLSFNSKVLWGFPYSSVKKMLLVPYNIWRRFNEEKVGYEISS